MMNTEPHTKPQTRLINPPTYINYKDTRFLIVDAPSTNNLQLYIEEFERLHVTDVVRCCDPTYSREALQEKGITVHDWVFNDGEEPPSRVIDKWLKLVHDRFGTPSEPSEKPLAEHDHQPPCIATHCVAGLGRAPVLVAIALIEEGMSPLDSVIYIRERRRGAINKKQLKFIESYKRRSKSRCIIS